MYRNTYAEINLKNVEYNVKAVIEKYNSFKYYFGVVKADCYGHGVIETTESIIKGGANYLAVATLEEALELREKYKDIPILCLGLIKNEDIELAISNNITLSILSKDYIDYLDINKFKNVTVHIKINTGMNRLGVSTKDEFNYVYNKLVDNNIKIEGIYSHIHSSYNKIVTEKQFGLFEQITSDIDLKKIDIIHIQASEAIVGYKRPDYVNGCRLGIIMYGLSDDKSLTLKSTFKVYSNVIQINELSLNDTVGYNGLYKAESNEKIAVIPIGYADGIIRKYTNGVVYINNKPYEIIGNVCMDMLFIKIDDNIKLFDKVLIIKDINHIIEIAKHLDTIPYEVICNISKRVPRIYIK